MPSSEAFERLQHVLAGFQDYIVPNKAYPTPLPADLAPFYVYTVDGGHCIFILPTQVLALYPNETAVEELLVPAPVKGVLRVGYTVRPDGFIECDLPYDAALGLVAEPGDDEF